MGEAMNVLITGGNRGIGLGFVEHYLNRGDRVWASHRADPGGLSGIDSVRLNTIRWDVGTDADPEGELPESIDLLINNAGIYGPGMDGQGLEKIAPEAMLEVFNVDCVGPLRVVRHLAERVIAAGGIIANVSSKMGSVSDNSSGGSYAYRAAKAGLNIISKSMAVDLAADGVHVITLHPGWVVTDMTHHTGLIDVATSVAGMAGVIARAREHAPGEFIAYDGKIVPY